MSITSRSLSSRIRPTVSLRWGAVAMAAFLATGCSVLEEDKIDYRSARQVNSLEVPPDLTQLSRESRYQVPGATVTASGYQTAQPVAGSSDTAASKIGDVRIERAGSQRWLVVDRPADKVWGPVKDFWQENGFVLTLDQETLGVMETDWAENRAKLPQDVIRSTLGKVFDSLYSTGEKDKFRTRLERTPSGATEIYISHRGMIEVYTDARKDQTVWQPRAADPELETGVHAPADGQARRHRGPGQSGYRIGTDAFCGPCGHRQQPARRAAGGRL